MGVIVKYYLVSESNDQLSTVKQFLTPLTHQHIERFREQVVILFKVSRLTELNYTFDLHLIAYAAKFVSIKFMQNQLPEVKCAKIVKLLGFVVWKENFIAEFD